MGEMLDFLPKSYSAAKSQIFRTFETTEQSLSPCPFPTFFYNYSVSDLTKTTLTKISYAF